MGGTMVGCRLSCRSFVGREGVTAAFMCGTTQISMNGVISGKASEVFKCCALSKVNGKFSYDMFDGIWRQRGVESDKIVLRPGGGNMLFTLVRAPASGLGMRAAGGLRRSTPIWRSMRVYPNLAFVLRFGNVVRIMKGCPFRPTNDLRPPLPLPEC